MTQDPAFFANGGRATTSSFGGNNERLIGRGGDDYFCIPQNQVAFEVNGGPGFDTLCGAVMRGNVEEQRCGCGLF